VTSLEHWQRLSPLAVVFIVLAQLQKGVRDNLWLFLSAGAGAAFTDFLSLQWLLVIGATWLVGTVLASVLMFKRFRFRIDGDAIRLRRGLFEQKELRVRFARIQNVELSQPFYFKPFNLARLTLQTPGAKEDEVALPGVAMTVAQALRNAVQDNQAEAIPHETEAGLPSDTAVLYAARWQDLYLHGMASHQVWVLGGALAYVLSQLMGRIETLLDRALAEATALPLMGSLPLLVGLTIMLGVAGLFALSGAIAVVRLWAFTLRRASDRVVATAGWLDRREQTAKLEKITGLSWRQSPVGRLLRRWSLVVRQTRSQDTDMSQTRGELLVPGLQAAHFELAAAMLSNTAQWPQWHSISWRYALVTIGRSVLLIVVVLAALIWALGVSHGAVLALVLGTPVIVVGLFLHYRHWGYAQSDQWLWVRQGILGQRIDVFSPGSIQQMQVKQSFYQRRHGLASLVWVLPHGTVTVPFLPIEIAADLANQGLAQAESAASHRV
jgi:putative membrane protein